MIQREVRLKLLFPIVIYRPTFVLNETLFITLHKQWRFYREFFNNHNIKPVEIEVENIHATRVLRIS